MMILSLFHCRVFGMTPSVTTTKSPTRFITNKMCPFAQKAWIALEASGTNYQLEEISLYGSGGKPNWFWELNPKGTVPVLVVCDNNNIVLPDSDLILNEIELVPGGETLVPTDESALATKNAFRKILSEFLPIGKQAIVPDFHSYGELNMNMDLLINTIVQIYPIGYKVAKRILPFPKRFKNLGGGGGSGSEMITTILL
eukprot:scaffold7519_cov54-Cylindrotheca_fusiformis.AAC.2